MLFQEQNLAKQSETWDYMEIWVDPVLFPPKIVMVIGDRDGSCRIFNPASDYRLIVSHPNYEAAHEWLMEDDYERADGQLQASEIL